VRRAAAAWAVAVAIAIASARRASAQLPAAPPVAPEVRVDLIAGHDPAIQFGAGVQIPAGYYARIGVDVAVGTPIGAGTDVGGLDGRIDILARFLLDPFRQTAYGLSLGGGASLRAERGERARPLLLVALDVEGRRSARGVVPALQIGLGGGVRVGVVLRRGAPGSR
jgi:hypothetical protein